MIRNYLLILAHYYITIVLRIKLLLHILLRSAHCFILTCEISAAMDRVAFPFASPLWYGTLWLRSKVLPGGNDFL